MAPLPRRDERGQVMPIVAVAFTVLIAFLAVLFDGAHGMNTRRQLQDAGDAAALAAANVIQVGTPKGCSASANTTPRASVAQAARDSLTSNLSWFDPNDAIISCPPGRDNNAVSVELATVSQRFFGGVIGGDINVRTRSSAYNGQTGGTIWSVVLLNPRNPGWPQARNGCPSMLLSGGPTVTLEGSVIINSSCPASSGGGLATNGNASNLTMTNGAAINIVGGYSPAALTINPAPVTGANPVKDPLAGLPPMDTTGMTVRSTSRLVLNNETRVLEPGIYTGGIQLRNSSIALMRPGIFVLNGGGLEVGAQATVLSIPSSVSTVPANWNTTCVAGSCGVLLYNTGTTSTMSRITVGAGATVKLRAYEPSAQPNGVSDYRSLLIWQNGNPVPTISYGQPDVELSGGGSVNLRGTVYAPSAKVSMGGGSGGAGGSTDVTLQFIAWDLEFRGNSGFVFRFSDTHFARPTIYGLFSP